MLNMNGGLEIVRVQSVLRELVNFQCYRDDAFSEALVDELLQVFQCLGCPRMPTAAFASVPRRWEAAHQYFSFLGKGG
jgi:hypothetical protein